MNLRVHGNFDSLFVTEKATKKAKIEKLTKEMAKLDREILEKQDHYNKILIDRAKLIDELERADAKN